MNCEKNSANSVMNNNLLLINFMSIEMGRKKVFHSRKKRQRNSKERILK